MRLLAIRSLVFIAAIYLAALPAYSQAANDQTFVKLQHDLAEARKARDVAFLENFYATEFTVCNIGGAESTRAQDIAMFSSGDLHPAVITDDELKVHIYGTTALVTGTEHLEGTYRGHSGTFDLRFSNVYVYRDNHWQLARHHATPIPKTP